MLDTATTKQVLSLPQIHGTIHSFGNGRLLPTFDDNDTRVDRFVSGYIEIRAWYDGFRNRTEIQPFRTPPGWLVGEIPVGPPYTIDCSLLDRMVIQGILPAEIPQCR